jgi:hypothetical protein
MLALLASVLLSFSLLAANDSTGQCNLEAANFKSQAEVKDFLSKLQIQAKKRDPKSFGDLIVFPVRVVHKGSLKKIQTLSEFNQLASEVITANVMDVILNQKMDEIFCNYQGIMLGDGEVWFAKVKGKTGIITINNMK